MDPSKNPLEEALPLVRAERTDLAIRPEQWDTHFHLPAVDAMLQDPLSISETAEVEAKTLSGIMDSAGYIQEASRWLGMPVSDESIAERAQGPVSNLLKAIARAQKHLDRAVDSLSPENRKVALAEWQAVLRNSENNADLESAVRASTAFDEASLLQAAYEVMRAVDRTLPALAKLDTPFEGKDLIVRLDRKSAYKGPVAAAGEKQIRVVIDFAEDVTIDSEDAPSAGTGLFGIGLLYLPNARGEKIIRTGDFSQGTGLFGVGGIFMKSSSGTYTCHQAGQGAAAFGVGLFSSQIGRKASYSTRFGGQGVGFPRGVGVFVHRGNDAEITGGLYYPDPREALAFTSLCQGVGYGPRAYAAGGVGLAMVQGNRNHVESSYFAQGAGYWLGYGGFFVLGDENHLQARRYDQGSGIHTAVGNLLVRGNKNTGINWGVGPAYGWDYGVGQFTLEGNENHFQADWGTGHGDINGEGLAIVAGDRNHLALPDFGTGTISRNAPSYGVVTVSGHANELIRATSSWGAQQVSPDTLWKERVEQPKPAWPTAPQRTESQAEDKKELQEKWSQAANKPPSARLADWLLIGSNFGLDTDIPRRVREKLWTLSKDDAPLLLDRVSPDRFDEFILLRALLSSYAPFTGSALKTAFAAATGTHKVQLLSLMSFSPPQEMASVIDQALLDPDWRIRRSALSVLGYWFNREEGKTPGRLYLLGAGDHILRQQASEKYLFDLFAILMLKPDLPQEDRLTVVRAQDDLSSALSSKAWNAFADVLQKYSGAYETMRGKERESADRLKKHFYPFVLEHLHDSDAMVVQAALITLGQWREPGAADLLWPFLDGKKAAWREGAATALAKLGPEGRAAIERALRSSNPRIRALGAAAAEQRSK